MAKDNGNGIVTVVSGDTLSGIAGTYLNTYGKQAGCSSSSEYVTFIAQQNNIKNPDLIYPGQKLYMTSASGSVTPPSTGVAANRVKITRVGLMADTEREVFAQWEFDNINVSHYQVQWWGGRIMNGIVKGEPVNGEDGEKRTEKWASWVVPTEFVRANVRVKPVSKTYKNSKGEDISYFVGQWSTMDQVDTGDEYNTQYNFSEYAAIGSPGSPSIEIDGYTLTATLTNIPDNVKYVQFQISKENGSSSSVIATSGNIPVSANSASYSTTIEAGGKYTARAKYINENGDGSWSNWSGSDGTIPLPPSRITKCEVKSVSQDSASVYLEWTPAVGAETYTIQYTTNVEYFAGSDALSEKTSEKDGTRYTITNGLEPGKEYFFRVRADNSKGSSDWTEPVSVILGSKPVAPTTWSSLTTVITGEPLTLYWVHNSKDGSLQTKAEVEAVVKTLITDDPLDPPEPTQPVPSESILFSSGVDVTSMTSKIVVNVLEYCVLDNPKITPDTVISMQYCSIDGVDVAPTDETEWTGEKPDLSEETSVWYRLKYTFKNGRIEYGEPVRVLTEEDFVVVSNNVEWSSDMPAFEEGKYVWCRYKYLTLDDGYTCGDPVYISSLEELEKTFGVDPVKRYKITVYTATLTTSKPEGIEENDERTMHCNVDTTKLAEGATINWKVRTAGVTNEFGEWSIIRTVNIYAPPTMAFDLVDHTGNSIFITDDPAKEGVLTQFPLSVVCDAGPKSQNPVAYHLSVVSNDYYETVDNVGRTKVVYSGEEVFSKYYDISVYDPTFVLSADNIDLENNITYTVKCIVSMDSGLTGENTLDFRVGWTDELFEPGAELGIDHESITAMIRPFCKDSDGNLVEGIKLSVYRREFDGSFKEIIKGLDNMKGSFVTDPHPALDYARYRIVAITENTGAVSYSDLAAYPVGEKGTVLQWDEEWSTFDVHEGMTTSELPWSGSMLKLMYNIDISDDHKPDVSLIKYVGREHPVTYYGTQKGHTASWSVEIPKTDKDTLYAVRRLASWMGDVYVREPSGTGYWANVTVSYSQTHLSTIIPIKLTVTRVEGGV